MTAVSQPRFLTSMVCKSGMLDLLVPKACFAPLGWVSALRGIPVSVGRWHLHDRDSRFLRFGDPDITHHEVLLTHEDVDPVSLLPVFDARYRFLREIEGSGKLKVPGGCGCRTRRT
jgi:hypothetical protein